MDQSIMVMHIDPDFKITYLIYRTGSSIQSTVSLKEAINLLKTVDFDLIVSEPHNKAILNNQHSMEV